MTEGSRIGDRRTMPDFPWRDHREVGVDGKKLDVAIRNVVYGVLVEDRDEFGRYIAQGHAGSNKVGQRTRADVQSALFAKPRKSRRRIGSWWLGAAPVARNAIIETSAQDTDAANFGRQTRERGAAGRVSSAAGNDEGWVPLRGPNEPDTRYEAFGGAAGVREHPVLERQIWPRGWTGLMTAGTEERKQREILHPDFLGLVADRDIDHVSTPVFDLDGEGKLDPRRYARLQSTWLVTPIGPPSVDLPGSTVEPAILAWQWGRLDRGAGVAASGPGRGGGLINDLGFGGTDVLACASNTFGGALLAECPSGRHVRGRSRDGVPVHPLHAACGALFGPGDERAGAGGSNTRAEIPPSSCGPLDFEAEPWGPVEPGPIRVPVHLRFDAATGRWRWESEAAIIIIPPDDPFDPGLPGGGGRPRDGTGKGRDKDGQPGPTPGPEPGPDPFDPGPFLPEDTFRGGLPGGGRGGGTETGGGRGGSGGFIPPGHDHGPPPDPFEIPGSRPRGVGRLPPIGSGAGASAAGGGLLTHINPRELGVGAKTFRQPTLGEKMVVAASPTSLAAPSFLFRPQLRDERVVDFRRSRTYTTAQRRWLDRRAPVVGHVLSFARQDTHNDYVYEENPRESRWPGGEAAGLVMFAPTDICEANALDSKTTTKRSQSFGVHRGATWGHGRPGSDGSTIVDGWRDLIVTTGGTIERIMRPVDGTGARTSSAQLRLEGTLDLQDLGGVSRVSFNQFLRFGLWAAGSEPGVETQPGIPFAGKFWIETDGTDAYLAWRIDATAGGIRRIKLDVLPERIVREALTLEHVAAAAVATPAAGFSTLFADSSNSGHASRKDSAGAVVDIEATGGGSSGVESADELEVAGPWGNAQEQLDWLTAQAASLGSSGPAAAIAAAATLV